MPKGVDDMDVWKDRMEQRVNDLSQGQSELLNENRRMDKEIRDLQLSDTLQNKEISGLKETLNRIQDDTTWIRRRITGAIITVTITAIVGGIIGIAISQIYGG